MKKKKIHPYNCPGILVAGHGPFTWGTEVKSSVINAEILEFIVKPESKVNGLSIKDINFPRSATIGGVIKDGTGAIVLGDYIIEAGDRVVVCCLPRAIRKVESLFQ